MCTCLRIEKVNMGRRDGLAKVLGTFASVGGATIITLYKGPPLLHSHSQQTVEDNSSSRILNWTWGCIYLLGHCLSWAGWMVFQVIIQLWDKLLRVKTVILPLKQQNCKFITIALYHLRNRIVKLNICRLRW